jgi:hypothetical protein
MQADRDGHNCGCREDIFVESIGASAWGNRPSLKGDFISFDDMLYDIVRVIDGVYAYADVCVWKGKLKRCEYRRVLHVLRRTKEAGNKQLVE